MGRISVLLVAASLAPLTVWGQDEWNFRCVNGDTVRRIEVAYPSGAAVPCEVRYHKDTEMPGRHETPWRADNEAGYCEGRAQALADRLAGFGWQCTAIAAAINDDTADLAAGSDSTP